MSQTIQESSHVMARKKEIVITGEPMILRIQHQENMSVKRITPETPLSYEPVHKKTNNLGFRTGRHKPACTVTEDG